MLENFFDSIFYIFKFFYIRFYLILIFSLNIFLWFFTYYIVSNSHNDLIILHYNVNFGVDLIGNANKLFIMPLLSLIISLINIILIFSFSKRKDFKFITHLLLFPCILINLFLFVAIYSIYLINFT